jgi:hypothetical protein
MSNETPNDPNPLDIDPEVAKLMGDLDQAMQSGDWTIDQAEQAVAESDWGRSANETDLIAFRGLLNVVREPNDAAADASDIIEQELGKVEDENMREVLASMAALILNRLGNQPSSGFQDRLAEYRKKMQAERLKRGFKTPGLGGVSRRSFSDRKRRLRRPQEPPQESE